MVVETRRKNVRASAAKGDENLEVKATKLKEPKTPKSTKTLVKATSREEFSEGSVAAVKSTAILHDQSRKLCNENIMNTLAPNLQPQTKMPNSTPTVPICVEQIEFEFGGPVGAFFVIIGLPAVIYALYFICNKDICLNNPFSFDWYMFSRILPTTFSSLISSEAIIIYCGWMIMHIVMERLLPGEVCEGVPLPDGSGKKLKYVMSGHLQFWLSLVIMGHAAPKIISGEPGGLNISGFHSLPLTLVYDHYLQLITVSIIGSTLLSIYLYASSYLPNRLLAHGGNTGYAVYDFFMGRELNPRIGTLDLKEFCELRPGLIGWATINLSMACKQFVNRRRQTGQGSISLSMFLVTLLQGLYVWDALYQEKAILSTMDITTDGFGFMLAFGDLSWVPFIYSLQARYLVDHDPELSLGPCMLAVAVQLAGYYIFRAANSEKDAFRKDPTSPAVAHLQFMETKRGTRLLTSGWWGSARKINYTGDWLVTLSWCLLCGWESPVPYFQAVYFLALLIHRAIRDDKMCAAKYGTDWEEYKRRVPYMFIPYVV